MKVFLHSWCIMRSQEPLSLCLSSLVWSFAMLFASLSHPTIGNGNGKMGCSSTLKTGVSEWGVTWCPHPPGQFQSGHHGLSHTLAWPAEPCVSVRGPYHWAHHPAGSLSSLCPSLKPPQGSCFLPGLFGVLPWEAQQIPRGCGSPGSQIPNALLFPDPPRAKSLASASVYNS